jgi:uncharacterized alkaline shock family protein YloU
MHTWPNGTADRSFEASTANATATRPGADTGVLGGDTLPQEPVEQLGAVRIARRVLRTVVQQAALGVHGVTRMATVRNGWPQLLARPLPQHGVSLAVHGETVSIDIYLIVDPGVSMVDVGTHVQEAVGAAVEHILGMGVSEINVYIQDVA